jgi:DNA-binding NarL/FixJ family response regulator/PAS domain-containing protein
MLQTPLHLFLWISTALTAVLAIWMARVAWRYRPTPGAKTLTWLMLAIAARSGAFWLIFTVDDPNLRLRIAQVSYFFVAATPVLGLIFVLSYTGFSRHFNRNTSFRTWLPFWIIPISASLLVLTYPWSRLIWRAWVSNPGAYATITHGPLQPLVTVYLWGLLLFAALLMNWYAFAVRGVHRRTALMVAAAMVVPIVPNLLWLLRIPPSTGYDFTYLGMLASAVLMLLAVHRGSLLDLRPIAHDLLLEQLGEALLVVDAKLRVVDCNRAAVVDLGLARPPLGDALPGLLAPWLEPAPGAVADADTSAALVVEALKRPGGSDGTLVLAAPTLRHLHWRVAPLGETATLPAAGWILTWRDVTQERLKLAILYEQERALGLLAERRRHESDLAAHRQTMLNYVHQLGRSALDAIEAGDLAAGATTLTHLVAVAGATEDVAGLDPAAAGHGQAGASAFLPELDAFLRDFGRAIGCSVDFVCNDPEAPRMLAPWVLVQLVRILQEVLQALHRDIAPYSMHVSLATLPAWITLSISLLHADVEPGAATPAVLPLNAEGGTDAIYQYLPSLDQESVGQRLAATGGRLTFERPEPARSRVQISLPRSPERRRTSTQVVRLLVAASQPARVTALSDLLAAQALPVLATTGTIEELIVLARAHAPELILVEWQLIQPQLTSALRRLRRSAGAARLVLLLEPTDDEALLGEAIRQGADGYVQVDEDPARLRLKLTDILSSDLPLVPDLASELLAVHQLPGRDTQPDVALQLGITDRQREILRLVVRGFTYREIAAQLYVSERTVRYDAEEIRKRMQVPSRAAMVEYAVRHTLA